jgi:tRNA A37 threonylcarbamoyladenosine synthetase subunit TsaC/SUA5/YrdC
LLNALGNPIISTSAHLPENGNGQSAPAEANLSRVELFDRLDKIVDAIVDDGSEPENEVSTIIDMTTDEPEIIRQGKGWEAAVAWV